jgi:putative membrane protein
MSATDAPPGVQAERTALAWRRTGLSALAGVAAIARLTYAELGVLAVVCACLGLVLVVSVLRVGRLGLAARHEGDDALRPAVGPGAACLAGVTVLLGLIELAALALRR